MHQQQTAFESIVGKGEVARNKQFLLFPQCFLLNQIIVSTFVHIFDIISLFAVEFEEPRIGISVKGLTKLFITYRQSFGPIKSCLPDRENVWLSLDIRLKKF